MPGPTAPARRRHQAPLAALAVLAASVIPIALAATAAPAHAAAAAASSKNVSANLFEWNFPSIAAECANVLGPDGYAAVQVAPPQDSIDVNGHPWWEVYQPVDYSIDGRLGTLAQFQSMVTACHTAGVKVYVDAVLNHMAQESGTSYGGASYNPGTLTYPAYSAADFHGYPADCPNSDDQVDDWDSYTDVTLCQVDGLPDLRTEAAYVRDTEAAYLNTLIGYGVDGFRLDSAKNIGETDIAAIEALLNKDTTTGTPVFISQEVALGSNNAQLEPDAFVGQGSVLGFDFAQALLTGFTGDIAGLDGFSSAVPSADSVSFVNNQDTERDGQSLSYKNGAQYTLATEFLLAYGYGAPQVYSSFNWTNYNDSPPSAANGDVANTVCGSGWQCTDQIEGVAGLVAWHNLAYTDNDPVANWYSDGTNLIAFSRGTDAWIAINNESTAQTHAFTTGLPNGTYCDIIHGTDRNGTCSGGTVTVSGGQATVTVPADDAVAFDVQDLISAPTGTPTPAATETVDLTVPVNTAAAGQTVYLDGNLSALGTGQADWAPNGIAMTEIDPTHYTATVRAASATTLSYKFTLGATWNNVEETGSCGSLANRSMPINGGTVTDVVATWAGPNTCGSAQAVIDVTVPSSTPSGDTVYLTGAFSPLGIGTQSANDWNPALYPMTRIGTDEWQMYVPAVAGSTLAYKFDLNGTWNNVEETGSCGLLANRSYVFGGADSSTTVADTVAAWDALGGC
jgi:alpha-amylase